MAKCPYKLHPVCSVRCHYADTTDSTGVCTMKQDDLQQDCFSTLTDKVVMEE